MALINCPECGKQISDKSDVCIGCGYPIAQIQKFHTDMAIVENESISQFDEIADSIFWSNIKGEDIRTNETQMMKLLVKRTGCNMSEAYEAFEQRFQRLESVNKNDPYTICPVCHTFNQVGVFTCIKCGHKYSFSEYNVFYPEDTKNLDDRSQITKETYSKGDISTKIKCPKCWSIDFQVLDTKKRFSLGKAVVGNTIGGALGGPIGAIIGAGAGIQGKEGKTKFVCNHCGNVWKQKV